MCNQSNHNFFNIPFQRHSLYKCNHLSKYAIIYKHGGNYHYHYHFLLECKAKKQTSGYSDVKN